MSNITSGSGGSQLAPSLPSAPNLKFATFGAGCFWGVEKYFLSTFPHLLNSKVGYTGGHISNPSYQQVCSGETGHAEALRFEYDPSKVSYTDLCKFFFQMHDPTTLNRQGNDSGTQYRSAIFYSDTDQLNTAKQVIKSIQDEHYPQKPIVTSLEPLGEFYIAEEYHQQYLKKNPGGYCNHRLRW